ncbi:putative pentatricopeptide repeat-containing protein At4g17915 [Arachis duranensis]|uniref:Pentatricopeptide repeat-containing protein At4g17915 n=1 Tax=Arachis duranensis TaxID=130453 RepID=A0A9C6TNT6_ARADU|nr:putative pentatricopeptide repeat-containing protein At4g17915 [Arachis duranensis]
MINGLRKNGYVNNAIMLFRNLQRHRFIPECRQFDEALEILHEMRSKGYTFDGYAYCTVIAALIKIGRIEEADEIVRLMQHSGRLDDAMKLLGEIEKEGLECDQYTHTIIINGLCKAGNFLGAKQHLIYMNSLGFGYNLVAHNCILHGLGKAGHIDHAMKWFESMEVKDSFTYTIIVHNLCRARRFLCASKIMVLCLNSGFRILRATQRAVIDGLCSIGYTNEVRKLKLKLRVIRLLHVKSQLMFESSDIIILC